MIPFIQNDTLLDICCIIYTDDTQFTNYNWSDYVFNNTIYGFSRYMYIVDFENKISKHIDDTDPEFY